MRLIAALCPWLPAVVVADLGLGDFLEGKRQVVLRPRLDQRRRELVERALAELVVVVVDLARALGGDDHEGVARVDLVEELIDAWMDHRRAMVAASFKFRSTIATHSSAARSRSSFSTTWSKLDADSFCSRASATRSSISPELSVARSRRRRSSSESGASTKIVIAPGSR